MPLENLAKKTREARGMAHNVNLGVLRHYIKTTSEERLVEEIGKFKDTSLLRTLWEAGLSSRLQEVVLKRLK